MELSVYILSLDKLRVSLSVQSLRKEQRHAVKVQMDTTPNDVDDE